MFNIHQVWSLRAQKTVCSIAHITGVCVIDSSYAVIRGLMNNLLPDQLKVHGFIKCSLCVLLWVSQRAQRERRLQRRWERERALAASETPEQREKRLARQQVKDRARQANRALELRNKERRNWQHNEGHIIVFSNPPLQFQSAMLLAMLTSHLSRV